MLYSIRLISWFHQICSAEQIPDQGLCHCLPRALRGKVCATQVALTSEVARKRAARHEMESRCNNMKEVAHQDGWVVADTHVPLWMSMKKREPLEIWGQTHDDGAWRHKSLCVGHVCGYVITKQSRSIISESRRKCIANTSSSGYQFCFGTPPPRNAKKLCFV